MGILHGKRGGLNGFFNTHGSIASSGMALNLDKKFLQTVRIRVIIGLLHEELECRNCGTRWRVDEPLPADYWRCPNGCNADHVKPGTKN